MIELDYKLAQKFLEENNLPNCEIKKIAGDASFRSYYRINSAQKVFILMFAPPSHEDMKPFVKVDEFLVSKNFSAPKIFAIDEINGFLLLEDFGDNTYGRALAKDASNELFLYKKAADVLLELHQSDILSDLKQYNNAVLLREVMLFVDWFLPLQKKAINKDEIRLYKSLWFELFDMLDKENQVVVLRDYHADNLMILPEREGFGRVGLLDFQDALIGSKAYDLVSLLEDARRDVDAQNVQNIIEYYLEKSGCNASSFFKDYAILSLQRNIKIIGIFARLSLRDQKHHYLDLLPRVIGFIDSRLNSADPIFAEISKLIKKFIQ